MKFSMIIAVGLVAASAVGGRMAVHYVKPVDADELMLTHASRLTEYPTQFGPWELEESSDLDEASATLLQCAGSKIQTFQNKTTGERVSIALVLGPTGPISVHSPAICYETRLGESKSERKRVKLDSGDSVWALNVSPVDSLVMTRVLYAWHDGNNWNAPWSARFAFIGRPFLYKLQVASTVPTDIDLSESDPARDFLQHFLPEIEQFVKNQ